MSRNLVIVLLTLVLGCSSAWAANYGDPVLYPAVPLTHATSCQTGITTAYQDQICLDPSGIWRCKTPGAGGATDVAGRSVCDSSAEWELVTSTQTGALAWSGDLTPATITADQSNYNPTGLATAGWLRLASDATRTIHGLLTGSDGRLLPIYNIGAQTIILAAESGTATAANRFALPGDLPLAPGMAVTLQYDLTTQRWRALAPGLFVSTTRANQSLAANATIQHAGRRDLIELVQISGASAGLTNSATIRILAGADGQTILLQGTSAANAYTIPDGNGLKWATAASVVFDDRTSRLLTYSTAISSWREGVTGAGGDGGGGTAATVSFGPTGTIASTNVQAAIAEAAVEAEQVANKNVNNGYLGVGATGKIPWDRRETPVTHPDLSITSQIDQATYQASVLAIQSSTAGNISLTTGNPRITGCTAGNHGQILHTVGLSATKTVTIPNGQGVLLAGNTGSVTVGIAPGGISVPWRCNGATLTWEQIYVAGAAQVFAASPSVNIYACGDSRNPIFQGGGGNYWEECLDATTSSPVRRAFCGGTQCPFSNVTNLKLVSSGTQPTCDSTVRFAQWPKPGAAGVADTTENCVKNASDVYAWAVPSAGGGSPSPLPRPLWRPAAGCTGTTAAAIWDLPTSGPAVAACVTGTNTQKGVLDFVDASTTTAQITERLSSAWTGDIGVVLKWFSGTGSTNSVVWRVRASCVADAQTDDPAWDADVLTMADPGKGTANQVNDASGTLLAASHLSTCAAGELLHLEVGRLGADGADTHAATARLVGVEFLVREAW
jgi:hypothetical protein